MNNGQRPILKIISVATFPLVSVSVNICRACDARPPQGARIVHLAVILSPQIELCSTINWRPAQTINQKLPSPARCGVVFVGQNNDIANALLSRTQMKTH